jgi:predicted ATPase/tetratricopeptide (TPR) repeat protein
VCSTPCASAWQLRLLGGFMLERGGKRLLRLHSRAAVALLSRLALQPQRDHGREELADWLWPEADLPTGLARLRQTLSTLKGVLERGDDPTAHSTVIHADRRVLRLVAGTLDADVWHFEAAARRRDRATAAQVYRGELLPGHYDEWLALQRQRLQALADGLGLDALVPQPAAAPPPPAAQAAALHDGLPVYLTSLVGGAGPAQQIAALVRQHRLLSLRGTGGLGKTRLAVATARRLLADGCFDAVRFVPWAGCTTWPAAAQRLAQALGQPATPVHDVAALAARALAGRRSLLVMDNCEQCDDEVLSWLPRLLATLPGLHLLLTTRRALGLAGQVEWLPSALDCPGDGATLAEVARASAARLFAERASATRADFLLHAGNADAVARVTRRLAGLPLAIELAAGLVRTLPPPRLAALLEAGGADRWRLLAKRGIDEPRHASTAAVVDASLAASSAPARRWLIRLAVVPAPVCGALMQHVDDAVGALQCLDELAGDNLLAPAGDDGTDRWWSVPEPVRDLVIEQLPPGARGDALAGWRQALLAWTSSLAPDWPLETIDRAMPLLSAVLQTDALAEPADVLGLVLALQPAWDERRPPENVRIALERALGALQAAAAHPVPMSMQQRARALAAELAFAAGQRDDARRHVAWLRGAPSTDRAITAQVQLTLARMAWRLDADAACAREALLRAAEADPQAAGQAQRLRLAATVAFENERDAAASEALLRQALRLLQGDAAVSRHLLRALRYNLAIAAVHAGRPAEALPLLDALVDEAAAIGNPRLHSDALNSRGSAHQALGETPAAEADTRSALAAAWRRLETESALYALWNLGLMAGPRGDAERAARLLGFADRFWRTHFGALSASDARDVARVRRRCRRALGRIPGQRCWDEGAALPLAAAVALALG